jgi:hypothetical protein
MKVTDKKYYMDDKYKSKLDLMLQRMRGSDDNILVIDGDEGQGKTEMAIGTCYYISYNTGRSYSIDNIFFDLDKLIKFASSTKEQIIHFDEAVLGLLVTKWQDKLQQKFITLAMVARKKKHFIVLCIPKFHRLPQYLIEERTIGLVHVYSRKNMEKGRFCYYTKKNKNELYLDWRKSKVKRYSQYRSFWGTFPIASTKIFTEEQNKAYDEKKDEAILAVGVEDKQEGTQSQRWKNQRDNLIVFIKNRLGFKFTEMEREFKKVGINDIDMEMARRAVRRHLNSSSL